MGIVKSYKSTKCMWTRVDPKNVVIKGSAMGCSVIRVNKMHVNMCRTKKCISLGTLEKLLNFRSKERHCNEGYQLYELTKCMSTHVDLKNYIPSKKSEKRIINKDSNC